MRHFTTASTLTQLASRAVSHAVRKTGLHRAIVVVTDSRLPEEGVALLNAEDFTAPFGPPVLQVANKHCTDSQAAMKSETQVGFVLHCEYVKAIARNVEAKIEGSNPELAPVCCDDASQWLVGKCF
ncbi:MAG: hypothetical protein ACJAVI_002768 [Candidatus Azotimanducaceae bacterium]